MEHRASLASAGWHVKSKRRVVDSSFAAANDGEIRSAEAERGGRGGRGKEVEDGIAGERRPARESSAYREDKAKGDDIASDD